MSLVYSTFLGGTASDRGSGIAVDPAGNAFVTGITQSSTSPTTPGVWDTTHNGDYDVFVTKLIPDGSALSYSTFVGGSRSDNAFEIAIDEVGRAYVVGFTHLLSNYPSTPAAYDPTHNGSSDAFVTRLTADGSELSYSTFLGGSSYDLGFGIAVDSSSNAYVIGNASSPEFPTTPGAFDETHGGQEDIFVTKLDAAGAALVYSTFIGTSRTEHAADIAIDATNYTTGPVFCDFKASGYRLPTEGEWEHFARAGTIGPFSIDEPAYASGTCNSCTAGTLPALETVAAFCATASEGTDPVAGRLANPWGLFDVHGNVHEFCWDGYAQAYPSAATIDYAGVDLSTQFALRGGSWHSTPRYCRSAARASTTRTYRYNGYGFRLVRTVR